LTKVPKTEKSQPLQQMLWENWISACRILKPCLSTCTSINPKWIEGLNIRSETLKLMQERAENTMALIIIGNNFLNRMQMAQQLRDRIDKWNYLKLRSFCTRKQMVWRGSPQNGRKALPDTHLTRD
jgi:hypothetical protein